MRIIFAGTPEFAVPSLRAASRQAEVVAVYTQPDRPAGRGRGLSPSPVKAEAIKLDIPVLQPLNFRDKATRETLREFDADVLIVVAYGLILPQSVLDIPRYGCWNVHASMLPRWRGAAPIQRAIQAGDKSTGVCLMQMEKGLDTGPVMLSVEVVIHPDETGGQLHDKLADWGGELVNDGLGLLRADLLPRRVPQEAEGVTYAHKLEKSEAIIDWTQPATDIANMVRAFNPWPVAETLIQGERVRVYKAIPIAHDGPQAPGDVLGVYRDGIDVKCGRDALRLLVLQKAGGRQITAADYINATPTLRPN